MKNILILLPLLAQCILLQAQPALPEMGVIINPIDDLDSIAEYNPATGGQTITATSPNFNMYVYKYGRVKYIDKDEPVIIRFFDRTNNKILPLRTVDRNMIVHVDINGNKKEFKPANQGMTDINVDIKELYANEMDKLKHYDPVSIRVDVTNGDYSIENMTYQGRLYKSKIVKYTSFNADLGGFWFPILLFSSNLKSTSQGVPFASLPVGAAWGLKYITNKGRYVGWSVMGNWLIYTEPENTSISAANSFHLASATLGTIIDFNDVCTIGYAHGFDFKTGGSNPGHMLVIGFGSKVLSFLK
ncbi:MAG: hypothetical protein EOP51_00290 [Sphingobacteriales bacterium]|nr:MAG: hypothetical protein EOP51_00290 [Sphingobacteriales bacterium]